MEHIVTEIEKKVSSHVHELKYISVSLGVLGLSMFYYYHYMYSKEEESYNKISSYLKLAIEQLNNTYMSYGTHMEMIELGLYLIFLKKKGLISEEDLEQNLCSIDDYIILFVYDKIREGNLDNVIGLLKAGNYFIRRKPTQKRNELLMLILSSIDMLAIKQDKYIYWQFFFRNKFTSTIELGLVHGVTGVVSFLINLYLNDIDAIKCKELIDRSISFLLSQQKDIGINLFPINAFEEEFYGYNNLNYGDLGIGYLLILAGRILNDSSLRDKGIGIVENSINYNIENRYEIKDASILYGASGLYSVFALLYKEVRKDEFLHARNYWFSQILASYNKQGKWLGFNSYYFNTNFVQLSFSQGLIGIGIALMSNHQAEDYLSFLNYEL